MVILPFVAELELVEELDFVEGVVMLFLTLDCLIYYMY